MILPDAPNIFKGTPNNIRVIIMNCKKVILQDEFSLKIAYIIKNETGINPFSQTTCRNRKYVQSRHLLVFMLDKHSIRTLEAIGNLISKNHSTILHSIQKVKDLCDTDKEFKAKYEIINKQVRNIR